MLERKMTWALACAVGAALLAAFGLAFVDRADANQCGASCKNAYNQCRISSKGSPQCEIQFTRCMQSCILKK